MAEAQIKRRLSRTVPVLAAAIGLVAMSLPLASAMAQSKNVVNCFDVDPIYHMNLISNPTCDGYWNHGLVTPQYPAYPYSDYGYGYGYAPYGYAQYPYGR